MKEFVKILKNRDYFLLWLGQSVSELGSSINYIGLIWYVMELTGSASRVSVLFIALTLPSIIVGPYAGVIVDRLDKKTIIIVTDTIRGLISILMAISNDLITIYSLVILNGIAAVFFSPAINVAIPRLVPVDNLMAANSLFSTTRSASKLIGPIIGGILIAIFGVKALFIINGISFLISAFSELWIKIPKNPESKKPEAKVSINSGLKSTWDYINEHEIIKFVIIFFAIAMLAIGGLPILNVVLVTELFNFSSEKFGLIMTIYGVGFLVASICMGRWGKYFIELNLMVFGIAVYGLCYALLTFASNIFIIGIMFFIIGFAAVMTDIAYGTYLQKVVADNMRGRVFSVDIAIGNVVGLISMGMVGILVDIYGVKQIVFVMGLLLFIHSICSSKFPAYKRGVARLNHMKVKR